MLACIVCIAVTVLNTILNLSGKLRWFRKSQCNSNQYASKQTFHERTISASRPRTFLSCRKLRLASVLELNVNFTSTWHEMLIWHFWQIIPHCPESISAEQCVLHIHMNPRFNRINLLTSNAVVSYISTHGSFVHSQWANGKNSMIGRKRGQKTFGWYICSYEFQFIALVATTQVSPTNGFRL